MLINIPVTAMKKTSGTEECAILISKKAYNDFTERIRQTLSALQQPSDVINEAVSLLDRCVKGEGIDLTDADMMVKVALMMLKPEIDKAVRRSSAARERARLRREKSNHEADATSTVSDSIETPACIETTVPSESEESTVQATSTFERPMNRRERREYEQELARDERRYERLMLRRKKEQRK